MDKVNPHLVRRYNNRCKIIGSTAKYYPFQVSQNDDVNVGDFVVVVTAPIGDKPGNKETDMRTVDIKKIRSSHWGSFSLKETDKHTVFLKDLSPVRATQYGIDSLTRIEGLYED